VFFGGPGRGWGGFGKRDTLMISYKNWTYIYILNEKKKKKTGRGAVWGKGEI